MITHNPRARYADGLLALAGLLLLNTLLGPLGLDLFDYQVSESVTAQLLGLELVTTFIVVPILAVAAVLVRRHRPAGAVLALGSTGYAAYMFAQYVLGPEYRTVPPQVLLHLLITALALVLLAMSWSRAARQGWAATTSRNARAGTWLLGSLAGLVLLRYLPLVAIAARRDSLDPEYAAAPTFYWSIVLLDLTVIVPAVVAAALEVHRRGRLAVPALCGVLGWFALVPPSLAAMSAVMLARDDPDGSWPTLVLLAAVSVALIAVALRVGLSTRAGLCGEADSDGARRPGPQRGIIVAEVPRPRP